MELAAMDGQVAALLEPLALEEVPRGCVEALYAFTCAASFRACTQVQTRSGTSLAVAAPPCRSVCDAAVQECGALFAAVGASELLPQCDAEDPVLAPLPAYPTSSLDIPGQEPIPCTAGNVLNKSAVEVRSVVDLLPGRCEEVGELPLSQCGAVIPPTTRVFVPDGSSQAALDAAAAERTGAFLLGTAPRVCRDAALEFVCAAAFRRCAPVDVLPGVAVELPAAPCFDVCDAVEEECHTFVHAELGQPPTVCDAAEYPSTFTALELVPGVLSVEVPCFRYELLQEPQGLPVAQCVEVSAEELQRSQCHAVVDYPVYVPEGLSVAELDAAAAAGTGPVLLGLVQPACAEHVMRFVCTSAFRPCVEMEVAPGEVLALPKSVCRETCEQFAAECGSEVVFQAPGAIPQCEAMNEQTMQPEYPEESAQVVLGEGVVMEVECAADEAVVKTQYSAIPAGRCEPMRETKYSQCSNIIRHEVFVPAGSTQEELDFNTYNGSFPLLWKVIEEACSAAAFRFTCASGFLGCDAYELAPGLVLSLPRAPCQSVCNEFNYHCEEPLTSGGEDNRVPCSALLPADEIVVPVSADTIFTATCVDPPHNVTLYRECPPYLGEDFDGDCVLECPNPMFNHAQWTANIVVTSVLSWASVISILITVTCFALHPVKRHYPKSTPAFHMLYTLPRALVLLSYSLAGGMRNVVCGGTNAPTQMNDTAWCAISSLGTYFGAWVGIFWYNWIGLTLLMVLTGVDNYIPKWVTIPLLHIIPLTVFVVWYSVVAGADTLVNGGTGGCNLEGLWDNWYPDVVFFIPFMLLIITASIMLASVFFYTVFVMGWKGVTSYWRIMAYLFIGLFTVTYSCVYHWVLRLDEDDVARNFAAWITCAAQNIDYERCERGVLIDFVPYLIGVTIVGGFSPPVFMLILLSDPMFTSYWSYLFKRYILRQDAPYPFENLKRAEKISENLRGTSSSTSPTSTMSVSQF
eukprot:TRINITY_DN1068_c1_g2_i4.p1 TRINITY_DN1068_c1_g2~~TRINITY_DN1068_c1_g2_i4.p1  ORF type:complete len:1052 (-),score=329.77 TRINITY_DN1068_c1_g2_i4:157-3072(-)